MNASVKKHGSLSMLIATSLTTIILSIIQVYAPSSQKVDASVEATKITNDRVENMLIPSIDRRLEEAAKVSAELFKEIMVLRERVAKLEEFKDTQRSSRKSGKIPTGLLSPTAFIGAVAEETAKDVIIQNKVSKMRRDLPKINLMKHIDKKHLGELK